MAYASKKGGRSYSNSRGNSSSGRGTVKRSAGRYGKSSAAKPAGKRVSADKPQTIRIEIVQTAPGEVARPGMTVNVKAPRRATF